ncbi:MAG: MoaD/ThiS family protein [Phycisphaerales bacterium]|nr:MAG: MoaD/ThiS family protein [Phycisphaerales bacterium]
MARAAGASSILVDVAKGASLAEARARLTQARPELASLLAACRFALNHAFIVDEGMTRPDEGDEVALIGLVSGG